MSSSRQVPFPQDESSIRSADGKVSLDDLFTRLYDKIHGLAARVRWSGTNPTLNPTALAHEAYIKLRKSSPQVTAETNKEAIGIFANAMHQILIDAARREKARKSVWKFRLPTLSNFRSKMRSRWRPLWNVWNARTRVKPISCAAAFFLA